MSSTSRGQVGKAGQVAVLFQLQHFLEQKPEVVDRRAVNRHGKIRIEPAPLLPCRRKADHSLPLCKRKTKAGRECVRPFA
jgi:hypothetical protein